MPYDGEPTWKITFTRQEMRDLIACLQIVAEGFSCNLLWYKRQKPCTEGWEGAPFAASCGEEGYNRALEFQETIAKLLASSNAPSFDLALTRDEIYEFGMFQALAAKFFRGGYPWPWGSIRARRAKALLSRFGAVAKANDIRAPILEPSFVFFIQTVDMLRS